MRHARCGWIPWLGNDDYCLQFLQQLGNAQEGASAISECLMTAARIAPNDDESWHQEWEKTAKDNSACADLAFAAGNIITAQANWLRASNYFRAAELFLKFGDPRRRLMLEQMRASSIRYLEYVSPPGEVVRINNFDGGVIEGYFLGALEANCSTPVVLCIGGPEHLKDEHLHKIRRHARDRQLSLLLVDLLEPGTFERRRMLGRHDAAMSISSCVDYLIGRGDVDEQRIGIYGEGLGASFATQAAVQDVRFSAAVCDGGMLDVLQRAFSIRQLVGADDRETKTRNIENLKHHNMAKRIHCPILITIGGRDRSEATYAADFCKSMKEIGLDISLSFSSAAASLGQIDNPTTESEFIFDWIASRLQQRRDQVCSGEKMITG